MITRKECGVTIRKTIIPARRLRGGECARFTGREWTGRGEQMSETRDCARLDKDPVQGEFHWGGGGRS